MTRRSLSLCAIGLVIGGCQLINGVADLEVVPGDSSSSAGASASSSTTASGGAGGTGANGGGPSGGTGGERCDAQFQVVWADGYGDAATQNAYAVAIDSVGSTWVVGDAGGTFDMGDETLTVTQPQDVLFAKLDPDGVPQLAKVTGTDLTQTAWGVAVDELDAVYIAGEYIHDLTPEFEVGFATTRDVFVVGLEPDGFTRWMRYFSGSENEGKNVNIAYSPFTKKLVVGGNYTGTMNIDSTVLPDADGQDLFVVTMDAASGSPDAPRRFGGAGNQNLIGLAAAPLSGRVALVGEYAGTLDFGNGPLPTPTGMDAHGFVTLLDGTATPVFSHALGGGSSIAARAVAFAPGGDIVVAGIFFGGIEFQDGTTLTATDKFDGFVVRYEPDGDVVWLKPLAGGGSQLPTSIAVAPNGTTWVGGLIDGGSLDCGCGELAGGGGFDGFVARFDAEGNEPFCQVFGDGDEQRVTSLAIRDGELRLAGFFGGTMQLGGRTLTSAGQLDVFVAAAAPE